jgi:Asp/Glu/hydantoin racemase
MRLWYQSYTDPAEHGAYLGRLRSYIDGIVEPGTEVHLAGLSPSAGSIHALTELRCAVQVVRNAVEAERQGFDGFVVGHFQDAGLGEAKSAVEIPVVGLGESSLLHACTLGRRVGLVTIDPVFIPWHDDQVLRYGLGQRVLGARAVKAVLPDFMAAFESEDAFARMREDFVRQVRPLVAAGAEVILPAGGLPMLLFGRQPGFAVDGAPVVNGIAVAVKAAEMAVRLRALAGIGTSRAGGFARPSDQALREFLES